MAAVIGLLHHGPMTQDDVPADVMVISAAVYVLGDELDAGAVAEALSTEATEAWRKGDLIPRPNGGAPGRRRTSGWVRRLHGEGREPETLLRTLIDGLGQGARSVADISGVDEASIDLFMSQYHGSPDAVLELTPELLNRLADIGLPLRLTFCTCDP